MSGNFIVDTPNFNLLPSRMVNEGPQVLVVLLRWRRRGGGSVLLRAPQVEPARSFRVLICLVLVPNVHCMATSPALYSLDALPSTSFAMTYCCRRYTSSRLFRFCAFESAKDGGSGFSGSGLALFSAGGGEEVSPSSSLL